MRSLLNLGKKIIMLKAEKSKNRAPKENQHPAFLYQAAREGNAEAVQKILDRGVNINAVSENYDTALQVAAKAGHTEIVRILLNRGADINIRIHDTTALHHAAEKSHSEIVTMLLDQKADINGQRVFFREDTPLHLAVKDAKTVKILLDRKADVHTENYYKRTALHEAARHSSGAESILILLAHGVDINAQDCHYETPLHKAMIGGHTKNVMYLLAHGPDINLLDQLEFKAEFYDYSPTNERRDYIKRFRQAQIAQLPYDLKALKTYLETMTLDKEIEAGAEKKIEKKRPFPSGVSDVVLLFLGNDIIPVPNEFKIPSVHQQPDPSEPLIDELHEAVSKGDAKNIPNLLQKGVNINIQDKLDAAALHWAVFYSQPKMIQLLLEKGANVNLQDKFGCTPLHLAARLDHIEAVTLLLADRGTNPLLEDENKKTALEYAGDKTRKQIDEAQKALVIIAKRIQELKDVLQPYLKPANTGLVENLSPAQLLIRERSRGINRVKNKEAGGRASCSSCRLP